MLETIFDLSVLLSRDPVNQAIIQLPPLLRRGAMDDLEIVTAGHFPKKAHRMHHRFGFHAVGVVVSGSGTYRVGTGPIRQVKPGSVLSVFPGPVFHYGAHPGTSWNEYYIGVSGSAVERWKRWGLVFDDGEIHSLHGDVPLIVRRFQALLRLIAQGGDADAAIVETMRVLLAVRDAREHGPLPNRTELIARGFTEYCTQHLGEPIDPQAVARELGVSYSRLRRAVRQRSGQAPAKLLTRLRCERARELLSDPQLQVKAVAGAVGIADPYVFSKVFKRTLGLAPRDVRRQLARLDGSDGVG
jgi:AraC-like DNA-binding protein